MVCKSYFKKSIMFLFLSFGLLSNQICLGTGNNSFNDKNYKKVEYDNNLGKLSELTFWIGNKKDDAIDFLKNRKLVSFATIGMAFGMFLMWRATKTYSATKCYADGMCKGAMYLFYNRYYMCDCSPQNGCVGDGCKFFDYTGKFLFAK